MLTCDYGTSWLGINALVIMGSFLVIVIVYLLSRTLPTNTKAKVTGITKIEITQIFISIMILLILFSVTSALCLSTVSIANSISSPNSITQLTGSSVPFPALQTANVYTASLSGNPFDYAESYTGNYAFNIGPNLGIQIYAYSYSFTTMSVIWYTIGNLLPYILPELNPVNQNVGVGTLKISFPLGIDLGIPYGVLSNLFLDVLAPLVTLGIGIMLIQYILLVASQSIAFTMLLPIAIVLRSLAFSGGALRNASNAVLAIAIGLYIIYPVMIIFDSYILHWIFTQCIGGIVTTSCNPSAIYLQDTYTHDVMQGLVGSSYTPTFFGIPVPIPTGQNILVWFAGIGSGLDQNSLLSFLGYNGDPVVLGVQYIILELSEFLFIVIVMFAINVTVTVGFSQGVARALNNGIEGAASFWSSL